MTVDEACLTALKSKGYKYIADIYTVDDKIIIIFSSDADGHSVFSPPISINTKIGKMENFLPYLHLDEVHKAKHLEVPDAYKSKKLRRICEVLPDINNRIAYELLEEAYDFHNIYDEDDIVSIEILKHYMHHIQNDTKSEIKALRDIPEYGAEY
jgi:hypothetical protein